VIANLLGKAAKVIEEKNVNCTVVKIGGEPSDLESVARVRQVNGAKDVGKFENYELLFGATAWGLSNEFLNGTTDLLVIDEAGQVPVSRLLALARCLRKEGRIILLVGPLLIVVH
jgi:superfamily I DNA and/or RNA helicase